MQSGQVKVDNGSAIGGGNKADFVFSRAHQNAQDIFKTYKLGNAGSRDEFENNMKNAINKMHE